MHGFEGVDQLLVRNGVLEADLRRDAAGKVNAVLEAAAPHAHGNRRHYEQGRQRAHMLHPLEEGVVRQVVGHGTQFHGAVHAEAGAVRVLHPRVEGDAAEEDRGEHGGDDAEGQGDGEAAHRARAELVEDRGDDDGRQVGVHDGKVGAFESGLDGARRRQAEGQLLAYPLEDEHVRVYGHADGEHDACDARQGQGRAERRHAAHEQAQGAEEHAVGEHAGPAVTQGHDDHDRQRADERGEKAAVDRGFTEGGADRALFEHMYGGRERAGPQGNGEVLRLFGRELAADARRTARDLFLNDRGAVDGAVQHDGEALAHMFAGRHFKERRAARSE